MDSPNPEPARAAPHDKRGDSDSSLESIAWDGVETVEYTPVSNLRQPLRLGQELCKQSWQGRELTWRLFQRNLRSMYRQTLLGLFWAFLPAAAQTFIWVFLNANDVVRFETEVPYTLYVLTGMLLWLGFVEAFQAPLQSIQNNKQMLSKINFPRETVLYVALGQVGFNFVIRLLLLIVVCCVIQPLWSWGMLWAIPASIGLLLLGTSLGLILAPIGTLYQDVGRFIGIATPFWMFLTPIIYPTPETWPGTLLVWGNPVSPLLIASRDFALTGSTTLAFPALLIALATLPLTLIGLIMYRLSMPILIERMNA